MDVIPAVAQGLAGAGGWAVVVAILIAAGVSFVRGWLVPRFAYDREAKRADALEVQVDRFSKALEALTDEIRDAMRVRLRESHRDGS